jgi:deoxyribodipyrimidine photo-lyase
MSNQTPTIVWFRNDLRLTDNPALNAAAANGDIIPIFIYDVDAMDRDYGSAQKWWLYNALSALKLDFKQKNIDFLIKKGDTGSILNDLIEKVGAKGIFWNRSYEKWSIDRDSKLKSSFKDKNLCVESFKANVLFEPWEIKNGTGEHYKVFTPFYKKCLEIMGDVPPALSVPDKITQPDYDYSSDDLEDLNLLPTIDWDKKMYDHWDISETGAWKRLNHFLENGLGHYKDGRDCPSKDYTSKMSPYLRWGMISPRSIWHEINTYAAAHNVAERDRYHYLSEIGWREFSFHLLYHYPDMKDAPLQPRFKDFPWEHDEKIMKQWQSGQTGYPLIDAGMRQLWATGWMHNRIRMIVGSLLVKHLLHSWVEGEKWFWDTLVDACPASNTAGWQWIGGCGADAAPYFRIFNPITQGDKFDCYAYVREFVPELKNMPDKYLFNPWEAPDGDLKMAGVELGKTYPKPIVSHEKGRERALEAFQTTK